jgi:hypothetical protein
MPLTPSECQELAALLHREPQDLQFILAPASQYLNGFRVEELKTIIRFYRDKFQRVNRALPNWISLYGKKQELVEVLRRAIQYTPVPPPPPRTPTPSTPSSSYQNQQVPNRMLVVDKQLLENDKTLAKQRGPFSPLKKVVEQATLVENAFAVVSFELEQEVLENLKRTNKGKYVVVIRAYSCEARAFVPWDNSFQIVANATMIVMPPKIKESKMQKSFRTVKGIDISAFVGQKNSLRIISRSLFGIAVVEINRVVSIEQVMQKVEFRSKPMYKCSFCRVPNPDLKRCSKCKHVYYCDEKHQLDHWEQHKTTCMPHDITPPMSPSNIADVAEEKKQNANEKQEDDDDEIEEVTNSVSLICPLMIDRLQVPAKGVHCKHANAFDLKMFLQLAEQSFNWQCPICLKPLPETDLRIDHRMSAILKLAPDHADEVQFLPDGSVQFPTEDESLEKSGNSEGEENESFETHREIPPPPPKKQKLEEVISIVDDDDAARRSLASSQRNWRNLPIPGSREEPIELD